MPSLMVKLKRKKVIELKDVRKYKNTILQDLWLSWLPKD